MNNESKTAKYYVPNPSCWPIIASIAVFCTLMGAAHWIHNDSSGPYIFGTGFLILLIMLFGWFGKVIRENQQGLLASPQVEKTFRIAMMWFIFSEAMFFFAFFGALFYVRVFNLDWLGGVTQHGFFTHILLWPGFEYTWPLLKNPHTNAFVGPHSVMETWHIPLINTILLLTSGLTLTVAHWGLLKNKRWLMISFQILTVLLGVAFLRMQVEEYGIAYLEKGLTLGSGIYGSTFFILTGFHMMHVTLGTIMLFIILCRMFCNHFTKKNHFAFEAVAWYWHFVDVVWLLLFIFVYWI
jgi:cytochrome c oxidase subunit III